MKRKNSSAFSAHQARTYRSIVEAIRTEAVFKGLRDSGLNFEETLLELGSTLEISRSSLIRRLNAAEAVHVFVDTHLTSKRTFPFEAVRAMFDRLRHRHL